MLAKKNFPDVQIDGPRTTGPFWLLISVKTVQMFYILSLYYGNKRVLCRIVVMVMLLSLYRLILNSFYLFICLSLVSV